MALGVVTGSRAIADLGSGAGFPGLVLAATSTTVTIPAFSSGALKGYDIRIIGGTGMGQRRIISSVAEPVIADTGVPTAVFDPVQTGTLLGNTWDTKKGLVGSAVFYATFSAGETITIETEELLTLKDY